MTIDFGLSKEQLDIQKAVREFANAEFTKDYILELELGHKFPFELWKKACDLGFIAIDYPEEYGGQGYNLLERVLVTEEFCRQGGGVGNSLMLSNFGCKLILKHGNEEQKRKYLIPACQGETISWAAFTEPDRGSDLVTFPLSTTCVRTNNGSYLINGTKTFITNATIASFGMVLCQTDFQVKPPYRGQSIMIVERDLEGVEVTEWTKMGMNYSPTTDLSLKDVIVRQENLLGEENKGFYYAMAFLNEVRIEIGAMGVGIAQGAFDRALNYSRTRMAFGRKIGEFQAISHKLAEMATKVETARLLTYKAAFEFDNGTAGSKVCSMAKWYSAKVAVEVADEAIEILGGHGYMLENEVERFYRDAKSLELVEGTREIHKNIIARNLLGRLS
jgi:alkylation response protein AidB-like acyl-CoA dehydrogenase